MYRNYQVPTFLRMVYVMMMEQDDNKHSNVSIGWTKSSSQDRKSTIGWRAIREG